MARLGLFDPPAGLQDLDPASAPYRVLRSKWSDNVRRWTQIAIVGDAWSTDNDANRDFYFNLLDVDAPPDAVEAPVAWTAFPGRILEFYGRSFPDELLHAWADFGGVPGMPANVCPPGDTTPVANTPVGPRGW